MTNILIQNLSEVITDFDKANQVTMVSPNNWSSHKHKLFGYSTCRQLRNAIKRKLDKQQAI